MIKFISYNIEVGCYTVLLVLMQNISCMLYFDLVLDVIEFNIFHVFAKLFLQLSNFCQARLAVNSVTEMNSLTRLCRLFTR